LEGDSFTDRLKFREHTIEDQKALHTGVEGFVNQKKKKEAENYRSKKY